LTESCCIETQVTISVQRGRYGTVTLTHGLTAHHAPITYHQYTLEDQQGRAVLPDRLYHVLPPEERGGSSRAELGRRRGAASRRHSSQAGGAAAANGGPRAAAAAAAAAKQEAEAEEEEEEEEEEGLGSQLFRGVQRFQPRNGSRYAATELQHVGWLQFEDADGVSQGAVLRGPHGVKLSGPSGDFAEWHRRPPDETPFDEGEVVGIWSEGLRRLTVRPSLNCVCMCVCVCLRVIRSTSPRRVL
jgi:hypothetical protein